MLFFFVLFCFLPKKSLIMLIIMLAYASIYEITYYAWNYASIIRQLTPTTN